MVLELYSSTSTVLEYSNTANSNTVRGSLSLMSEIMVLRKKTNFILKPSCKQVKQMFF